MVQTLQSIDETMDRNYRTIITTLQANINPRAMANPRVEASENHAIQVHQQQHNQGIDSRWETGSKSIFQSSRVALEVKIYWIG